MIVNIFFVDEVRKKVRRNDALGGAIQDGKRAGTVTPSGYSVDTPAAPGVMRSADRKSLHAAAPDARIRVDSPQYGER